MSESGETRGVLPQAPMTEREYAEHLEREMKATDWFAPIRKELEELFERSNDPTAFLMRAYDLVQKGDDEYYKYEVLEYILTKGEWIISLLDSDIPDVADTAYLVLSTATILSPEHGGDEVRARELEQRLLDYIINNHTIFTSPESLASADFGLRFATLGRLYQTGTMREYLARKEIAEIGEKEVSFETFDRLITEVASMRLLGGLAHHAAMELLQNHTFLDAKTGMFNNAFFCTSYVEDLLNHTISKEDLERAARGLAARFGAPLDMRLARNKHLTEEERTRRHFKHFQEWMNAVLKLEEGERGRCDELKKRFGLINFHHYPFEVVLNQHTKQDMHVPYGIAVFARYDWNDALFTYDDWQSKENSFRKMCEELHAKGMHVRIIEVDSKRDLAKRLAELDKTYGQHNKISFVYMNAHGGEEDMQLGNMYGETLTKKDFEQLRDGHLASYFVPGVEMLVNSCYAGNVGGIAEAAAKVSKARVQAPVGEFNGYEKIEVAFEGEIPRFSVTPHKKEQEIAVYAP